jgi:hypothetical protein
MRASPRNAVRLFRQSSLPSDTLCVGALAKRNERAKLADREFLQLEQIDLWQARNPAQWHCLGAACASIARSAGVSRADRIRSCKGKQPMGHWTRCVCLGEDGDEQLGITIASLCRCQAISSGKEEEVRGESEREWEQMTLIQVPRSLSLMKQ